MIELKDTYKVSLVLEKVTENRTTAGVTSFHTNDVSLVYKSCFLETGNISEALAYFHDLINKIYD